jgi:iduronate 2-sulfatase
MKHILISGRATWAQHFKNAGYYTARVSKIYHMGVPGGIEVDNDGADDPASWTEKFNRPGPEWKAKGVGETLEGNPDGTRPVVGGNTFVVVEPEGDDLVHSDGKTAAKAVELIQQHAGGNPFFLAVRAEFAPVVESFKAKLAARLRAVRENDLANK